MISIRLNVSDMIITLTDVPASPGLVLRLHSGYQQGQWSILKKGSSPGKSQGNNLFRIRPKPFSSSMHGGAAMHGFLHELSLRGKEYPQQQTEDP